MKITELLKIKNEERRAAKQDAAQLEALPADDTDLEAEAALAAMLDDQLSADAEDIMDDLGLDMNEILRTMTQAAQKLPKAPSESNNDQDTKGQA